MEKDEMKNHTTPYKGVRWQVIFYFLFSWLCHLVSGQIQYSILEEMRKDSVIANIAKDLGIEIKQLSSRKLRVESRISEKYFYVSLDNGNLYVKDRIDRETLCRTSAACFLTFDAIVENPFNIFIIKIEIKDINDNDPAFYPDTIHLEITENTLPGSGLALQSALDPDIGSNSIQSYQLINNPHFSLHEKTNPSGGRFLELVIEKPLDREAQHVHKLTLTALDGGNPARSGTASIKIIVLDANDNFPVFLQDMYKIRLYENTPVNTTITTVNATDRDEGLYKQITYSLFKTSTSVHDTDIFNINPISGEIKTRNTLDYELMEMFELSVQAKDGGGLVSHCKVLIEIIDVNDNAPEISITSVSSPIPEDSAPGTVIAILKVHDQDSGANGDVDCKLGDLLEASFNLKLSSSNYYRLVTSTVMDREKISSYNIPILATDRGSPPLSSRKMIQLEITDVNDNPPVFIKSIYTAYVAENNLPGASIYSLEASDADSGHNAKFFYSIFETNAKNVPLLSYLSINRETGVLYAQTIFDYEQIKEFVLNVTAVDNGSPPQSSNTTLIIHIVDKNDNAPKILYPSTEGGGSTVMEMVPFNSEQGSLITKVVAVDADSGHNAWLSYHFIQASEPSYFFINEHTGEIRTSRVFEEKDILKHRVVVVVKDNGDPSLSATVTLSLLVADNVQQIVPNISSKVNDEPPNNLKLYLIIALATISFLFIITVMLVILSKCREPKYAAPLGSFSTNLYPTVDPRILSMYSDGTLSLPYSYNVCVALDSCENDFTYVNSKQEVFVENLIDNDDSGIGNEHLKAPLSSSISAQVSL